jgi:hypothetical protein
VIRPTSDESQSGFDQSGPSGGTYGGGDTVDPAPGGTYDGGDTVDSVPGGTYGGGDAIATAAKHSQPKTNKSILISLTPHSWLILKIYNDYVYQSLRN